MDIPMLVASLSERQKENTKMAWSIESLATWHHREVSALKQNLHAIYACFSGVFLMLLVPYATAETVCWEEISPGVDWCATSDWSSEIHWTDVDLTQPELYLRVTREEEGPLSTSGAATLFGSVVTINGDWLDTDYNRPLGLSVGNGWHFPGTHDWDGSINPPGDWSFFSCTAEKLCQFDEEYTLTEWNWRWLNMIGGNGDRMVVDGELRYPSWDDCLRPRSAICLNEPGTLLRLMAAEGDNSCGGGGISTLDWAAFAYELGCYQAMSLDGGGSSDLVILGVNVIDRPPLEPAERTHWNHLSVLYNTDVDPACSAVMNGRYCEGEVLWTCQGGMGEAADCAFFGLSCEEGEGTAYCVDPHCVQGAHEDACLDEETMLRCTYGQGTEFSCSALFGASCENTETSARCIPAACILGGDAIWCDGEVLKVCSPDILDDLAFSTYLEIDCGLLGQACSEVTGGCVAVECLGREDGLFCEGDLLYDCLDGALFVEDCLLDGRVCVEGECMTSTTPEEDMGATPDAGQPEDLTPSPESEPDLPGVAEFVDLTDERENEMRMEDEGPGDLMGPGDGAIHEDFPVVDEQVLELSDDRLSDSVVEEDRRLEADVKLEVTDGLNPVVDAQETTTGDDTTPGSGMSLSTESGCSCSHGGSRPSFWGIGVFLFLCLLGKKGVHRTRVVP
jgi:hypothetical protein